MARAKMPHGGGNLPSWLSIRKDNEIIQAKLDRIAKIVANASSDYEAVDNIRQVLEENE